jgi:tetratricopeptide (TPR) repeat protein
VRVFLKEAGCVRIFAHGGCFDSDAVKAALLLLPFLVCLRVWAEDPKVTALIVQGDAEEREHHTRAALSTFRAAEQIEPRNVGVLLRISKQYSDLISDTKPESVAQSVAQKALDYAQRAVVIDPRSAKAHLSVAVSYGKLTDFVSNKTKVEYSRLVREETLRSIELDPTDDFAWHVLGRWHQGVANVSGVLKALAKVAYGGLPPASNEEAVRCMKKAIELAPQRLIHHSELARIYKTMRKPELAAKEWQTILDLAVRDKGDEKDLAEARQELRLTSSGKR